MATHPSLLETILGSFSPLRLHMRLSGSQENYLASDDLDINSACTWVHEYFHFLQSLFTGFGHITWDAHRQSTSFLFNEWKKWSAEGEKRRLPLAHIATGRPDLLFPLLVADRTVLSWILISQARYWMADPGRTLDQLEIMWMPFPWVLNPDVSIRGTAHILQGKEILEGHAFFIEATFRELCGLPREAIWSDPTVPRIYKVALEYFIEQCGHGRFAEFPFICDLALQTSWNPVTPTTEEEWRAASPSWRFYHLTQALRDLPDLRLGSLSELPQSYESFADAILVKCGYKPLRVIIQERLDAFQQKPGLTNFQRLMESGMKFRQAVPWCGGNPVADEALWEDIHRSFKVPMIEIGGTLNNFGTINQDMNNESVMELHYQAFAAQIFGEFSEAAVREEALECAFSKFGIHQGCEFR